MNDHSFTYVSYIGTTPENLWQALLDPTFTSQYWGVTFEANWRAGAPMIWNEHGVRTTDPDQVVLEFQPCRRLSYSWHTFTPQWARTIGISESELQAILSEPRSKVMFDIEPLHQSVKLLVPHSGFEKGSRVLEMIQQGWPLLLSRLKTLLETGYPLPMPYH